MRILKTILASIGFIPLSFIGQFFGWYFAIFCLFMWSIAVRGGVDATSPVFSLIFSRISWPAHAAVDLQLSASGPFTKSIIQKSF